MRLQYNVNVVILLSCSIELSQGRDLSIKIPWVISLHVCVLLILCHHYVMQDYNMIYSKLHFGKGRSVFQIMDHEYVRLFVCMVYVVCDRLVVCLCYNLHWCKCLFVCVCTST